MSQLSRRSLLKGLSLGAGGFLFGPMLARLEAEAAGISTRPCRFVFLVEGNGLWSHHVQPVGLERITQTVNPGYRKVNGRDDLQDVKLSDYALPESLEPLAEFQDRLSIVQGLSGRICGGGHSNEYGGLGCYPNKGGPRAETIDAALARNVPAIHRHVGLGISRDDGGDIVYDCSAAGPNQKVPIYINPALAYESLFGNILRGNPADEAKAQRYLLDYVVDDVKRLERHLPSAERHKLNDYWQALESIGERQARLGEIDPRLIGPQTELYRSSVETDRLDAHFDLTAMALITGMTNVVTLASGVGQRNFEITFKGLGINANKHHIGHLQVDGAEEMAIKIRQYHMQLVARLARALDAVPEGDGTMLDNTLIVYLSENAEGHHSTCYEWPTVMLGDLDGRLRGGNRFLCYPRYGVAGHRTMANLFTTLLHVAGDRRERFGMKDPDLDGALPQDGPLEELLVA
ncbi:MAG: DUF1552 domain-containing protein [Pirellulales bacterium]